MNHFSSASSLHLPFGTRGSARRRSLFEREDTFKKQSSLSLSADQNVSTFFVAVLALAVLLGTGFAYIRQVNTSAVGGYDVSSLERKVSDLKSQEQALHLETAELQSLQTIEKSAQDLHFIPSQHVTFTSPLAKGAVAFATGDSTNR